MDTANQNLCYHCGLPLTPGDTYPSTILKQTRDMCCPGCQAVSEAIVSNGLEDYYRFRTEYADKGDESLDSTMEKLTAFDHPEIQTEFIIEDGSEKQIQLTIEGISCAACGWLIEKQLLKLHGISRVAVNVSARRATVTWSQSQLNLSDIIGQLEQIGYHALPFQPDEHEASFQKENKRFLRKLGLSGLMSMQVMMLAIGLYFGVFGSIDDQTKHFFHWVSLILSTPVVLYSGSEFYRNAMNGLRVNSLNMDFSVTIAILGTFFSSAWATVQQTGEVYFESVCMFVFLLLISRYLEHRTRYRASQISANMLKYIPVSATLFRNGMTESILAKHLKPHHQILVKPGETFPVDGLVIKGDGSADESMLTGESNAVKKQPQDTVFGGTINVSGNFIVEVTNELKLSLVNKILRLQENALANKPKAAIYADKASRYFVVIVLIIAALSYGSWLIIQPDRAFWIMIAILVATCPCALSLATPTALTSAIAKLNQYGLLVKKADVLDILPEVDTIVFDKTGTLTKGHSSVTEINIYGDITKKQAMTLAASLESYSEHPIAKAFADHDLLPVENVKSVLGFGIQGVIDGLDMKIGHFSFMAPCSKLTHNLDKSLIYLQQNKQLVASFRLADTLRDEGLELIKTLKEKRLVLLSGDDELNVKRIGEQLGIGEVYWRHSPEQKLNFIRDCQKNKAKVLMVGDGINDAPVLAAADVSIAMGEAADMSKRSADILMLNPKLANINKLFSMAVKSRRKIKQNMAWAVGYNVLVLPLAVTGLLTPWMAVVGMSLSSIIVVSNSVRLLK